MQAFDQAWAIVKMPYHGTDSDSFSEIMSFGINPGKDDHSQGLSFAAGLKVKRGPMNIQRLLKNRQCSMRGFMLCRMFYHEEFH